MKKNFNSPTKGKMNLGQVTQDIVDYIKEEPEAKYKLIIGSDSEGNGEIELVTAIVIYRKKKGGRYFWKKIKLAKIFNLRQKIYKEVEQSLLVSQELIKQLKNYLIKEDIKNNLEIHIDVGENGPTKDLIREVVGMVLGFGFRAKTKPSSFGASMIADRHL